MYTIFGCMKAISHLVILLLFSFSVKAQSKDSIRIQCADLSPIYNVYEINKVFFSFPSYGQALLFRPEYLITGKQYFKINRIPYWLRIDLSKGEQIPKGVWVKPFQGDCRPIDTFLYKDIKLKYPLEIDGEMLKDTVVYNNENQPVIIISLQFVKSCDKFRYKHFEITTKKAPVK